MTFPRRFTPPSRRPPGPTVLALVILSGLSGSSVVLADAVSQLPARWSQQLQPVSEADISGAEPLMQQALREARDEVNQQLLTSASDPVALGRAYGRLGARLMLLEVETQADACLRNAMRLDPNELRWPYYAGYMAMLAGNLERALAYLEQAAAIDAGYPTLSVRLGKVQLDRGDLDAAGNAFQQVIDVPELRSPAQYYLGQIALLERRYADARAHLEAALEANPNATEVHYPLARAYQGLGLEAEARAQMERFVLRSPQIHDPLLEELSASTQRALPAFERAMHAVRQADYATASDEFAAGLAVDPENAEARVSYARVLFLNGEAEQSEQALLQVVDAASTGSAASSAALDPITQQQASGAERQRPHQRTPLAVDEASSESDLEGADQPPPTQAAGASSATARRASTQALAYFFLGVLRQANGDAEAAADAFRAARAIDPQHAGALFQLANLDFAAGRYEQAAAGYQAALAADPKAAPARMLQLLARARAGADQQQLMQRLRAVREREPDDDRLAYAEARLRATAVDPEVKDPNAAMEIAVALASKAPIPPHQRLLALATAAAGEPQRAAEALQNMITAVGWMAPPAEQQLMTQERDAFVAGKLPQPPWPEGDPLLSPPPFDAMRLFRDYPAVTPF